MPAATAVADPSTAAAPSRPTSAEIAARAGLGPSGAVACAGQAAGAQARQGPRRRPRQRRPRPATAASSPAPTSRPPPRERRLPADAAAPCVPAASRWGLFGDAGERETRVPIKGVRKMTAQAMVGIGLHGAARHRVGHRRRHRHDGARRAAEAGQGVPRRQGHAAAGPRQGDVPRGAPQPRHQRAAGTRPPRRSCSSTTSTSASPPPPRAGWSSRTSRTPTRCRCASSPRPSAPSRPRLARAAPSRPTWPAAPSPSPTSASSASTPARPILNPGEAAILAFGTVGPAPVGRHGADGSESIEPRWVTTLALSFDHRLVDGELGSRYLADVAAILADPSRALVWG